MRRSDSGCGDSATERTGVGRWHDRRERDSATVGSGWLEARRAGTAVVCRGRGAERRVGWSCGRLEDHPGWLVRRSIAGRMIWIRRRCRGGAFAAPAAGVAVDTKKTELIPLATSRTAEPIVARKASHGA